MRHQAPPGPIQIVAGREQVAVFEHQPSGRHLVEDLRRAWRQAHQVAVAHLERLRHLEPARQRQVLVQVARLAVHRDRDLRLDPAVHLLDLVAAGMAGDVHEVIVLGDHLDAARDQAVVQIVEGALVARDDLGREDHHVLRVEPDDGCCPAAIRARAARGSPWQPVASHRTLSRGSSLAVRSSISSGTSCR